MHDEHFDVAVIGGGPAGMMAAGRAAELGAKVMLLEKNATLGKKLLITGGGRCNILHAEFDTHRLVEKYGKKGQALFSTFSQLDAQATWDFFETHGLTMKIEAEQRAFPKSEKAEDVQKTMIQYMKTHGVTVKTNAIVKKMESTNGNISKIILLDGVVTAKRYILATGGKSHPETGSTGDGFVWMKALGHTVNYPDPALVPVTLKDRWISKLSGISLKDVKLTVMQQGSKKATQTGKMLFTHVGISGPLVLNMSKRIGELLKLGEVTLLLDLFPRKDLGALNTFLLEAFEGGKNKRIKNNIGGIVPPKLGHALLRLAEIPASG